LIPRAPQTAVSQPRRPAGLFLCGTNSRFGGASSKLVLNIGLRGKAPTEDHGSVDPKLRVFGVINKVGRLIRPGIRRSSAMPLSIPGDNGEAPLARPGHALAKRVRLAEGHRARQRDSRDRITGLRLAATTVRAIPTPSSSQSKGGSISASPAKRPLGCAERCIRNLAARQRRQSQRFLRLPMLRLHWRRPAIRGKIQPRRFSVAHKSQRMILGDDDGSGHCEVVQSNEGLWIHSAARWWRQRCVRTHQRSRTRRSEFTQRRTDR
jgi:hypothetical protein